MFETKKTNDIRPIVIISIVVGFLSMLCMPILFSPAAIATGLTAVLLGDRAGWIGVFLGILGILILTVVMFFIVD